MYRLTETYTKPTFMIITIKRQGGRTGSVCPLLIPVTFVEPKALQTISRDHFDTSSTSSSLCNETQAPQYSDHVVVRSHSIPKATQITLDQPQLFVLGFILQKSNSTVRNCNVTSLLTASTRVTPAITRSWCNSLVES